MAKPTTASTGDMKNLHKELCAALHEAIQPETILDKEGNVVGRKRSAAALAVAVKFLKDNRIEAVDAPGSSLAQLRDAVMPALPTFEQDYEDLDDARLAH
jgi:hypothetical protein